MGESGREPVTRVGGRPIDAANIVSWEIGETTAVVADLATGEYLVALWVPRADRTDAAIHCRDAHAALARNFGETLAVCDLAGCARARAWRPTHSRRVAAASGL